MERLSARPKVTELNVNSFNYMQFITGWAVDLSDYDLEQFQYGAQYAIFGGSSHYIGIRDN